MSYILLPLLLFSSLSAAHTVTIHSDFATAALYENGYRFTHHGKIRMQSDSLGALTCSRATCLLTNKAGSLRCDRIITHNVTLRHKTGILTAQNVIVLPEAQRCIAQGTVRAITLKDGHRIRTTADAATLNLKTHSLHTQHKRNPVTLRIESALYEADTRLSQNICSPSQTRDAARTRIA